MIRQRLRQLKRLPLNALFGRWRQDCPSEKGYTILLPSPMDMPFMLRLGLEGLLHLDTSSCIQILVVPDGRGDDRGEGLRRIAAEFDDPRIEIVDLRGLDYRIIRAMRPLGCAHTHWMMVVNGVLHTRGEYAFLHDADAFFLDRGGLERQYREASDQKMHTYGVESRWDPFFTETPCQIPGTWELMFATRWARSRPPTALMPATRDTDRGEFGFDSMLYSQYLDRQTGKIGVMQQPPQFVHFHGTIVSYRMFRDARGAPVTDELFRVLLLSLIESSLEVSQDHRACPSTDELVRGLTDQDAPVQYTSDVNRRGYGEFRSMVTKLCQSPVFSGARSDTIRQLIKPFDDHFGYCPDVAHEAALSYGEIRESSIGQVKK